MTEIENSIWFLLSGALAGMLFDFWFIFDIDFYKEIWPVMLAVLAIWALVRRDNEERD